MYQSIYINAMLLTILIYRIKIYLLRVLSSMDLWRIWDDLWNYCQLLPTIANYCLLLLVITNYCRLMTTIADYCRLLPTIANILFPTRKLKFTGTIVWEIYTPCLPGKLTAVVLNAHFEIPPFQLNTYMLTWEAIIVSITAQNTWCPTIRQRQRNKCRLLKLTIDF